MSSFVCRFSAPEEKRTCRIRKISGAVEQGRDAHNAGLDPFQRALALMVPEEKYFALLDRSTECSSVLVLLKGRALRGKVTTGVQIRIAQEFKCRPVIVSAGFGNDVNKPATVASIFGVGVAADDSELSD